MASRVQRKLLIMNGKGLDARGETEESRLSFKSSAKLRDYDTHIQSTALRLGTSVEHVQTNVLEECIKRLQSSQEDAIVINPAGFMSEKALVQCIAALHKPVIEVHYGNLLANGVTSMITPVCNAFICGAKLESYSLGMHAALAALEPSYVKFDYPPKSSL